MKNLLLLLMVLVSTSHCIGQTDEKALETAKNYINYKMVYWVLKEKAKSKKDIEKDFEALRPTLESITINNNPDYNNLAGLLANKKVLKKVAEPISFIGVRQFASYPPDDAAKKLIEACLNQLPADYNDIKDTIASHREEWRSQIVPYLRQFSAPPPAPTPVDTQPVPPTPVIQQQSPPAANMYSLILSIVSILAIIGLFYFFWKEIVRIHQKLRLFEELEKNRQSETRRKSDKWLSSWESPEKTATDSREVEKMIVNSNFLQSLSAEVEKIKQSLEQINRSNRSYTDNGAQSMGTNEKTDGWDVFYMTGPVNNYFPNTAKSIRKEGTVYKFTVKANKQEASFETHIAGGTPVSEIVKRNESYIKPACVEENVPDSNTRNIITKKSGLAILEGDKWVIKTKAVIKYE